LVAKKTGGDNQNPIDEERILLSQDSSFALATDTF